MKNESSLLEFNLCQQLSHHAKSIRSVTSTGDFVLTGSLDLSCGLFHRDSEKANYNVLGDCKLHDQYVFKVLALKSKDGFLTASKDRKIIQIDLIGNPVREYLGHEGAVNSLSQYDSKSFISGSWDGTAKIWSLETGLCTGTLKDHSHAVAVCALQNNIYVTGSQDKRLRFWIRDHNTKNIDNAHEDIIRDISPHSEGLGLYTCSNDETIKFWNLSGQNLKTLSGHEAYVYRVYSYKDFLFSSGEDKVVKIWYRKYI